MYILLNDNEYGVKFSYIMKSERVKVNITIKITF